MNIDMDMPLKSSMFGHVSQNVGFWHKGRVLDSFLLIYLTQGELEIKIGDKIYSARAGDVLTVEPGQKYIPQKSSGCGYYFFHFNAYITDEKQLSVEIEENTSLPQGEYAYSYNSLRSILSLKNYIRPESSDIVYSLCLRAGQLDVFYEGGERMLFDAILREILVYTFADFPYKRESDVTLRKIKLYIQNNYKNDITLSMLSEHFALSKSYIARLFKMRMKTTTSAYLNKIRISAACELLINSDARIGKIADITGYKNIYYFSRIFKDEYGISPAKFRTEHLT